MPYPMPVVGSADSPSVAHNDPYQLFIAVATSTCQSEAPSHPRQRIWMKWWERQRQKEMAIRPIWSIYGLNRHALMRLLRWVCVEFVSASINGKWRRTIGRERHLRHQEQWKVWYEAKTGHKVQKLHDKLMMNICWTQTTWCNKSERNRVRIYLRVFFSPSAGGTEMMWPRSFLWGCLLMCVDIGELHPQSSLSSHCRHYSISFHSLWANKARFFCWATHCACSE